MVNQEVIEGLIKSIPEMELTSDCYFNYNSCCIVGYMIREAWPEIETIIKEAHNGRGWNFLPVHIKEKVHHHFGLSNDQILRLQNINDTWVRNSRKEILIKTLNEFKEGR